MTPSQRENSSSNPSDSGAMLVSGAISKKNYPGRLISRGRIDAQETKEFHSAAARHDNLANRGEDIDGMCMLRICMQMHIHVNVLSMYACSINICVINACIINVCIIYNMCVS